MPDEAVSNSGPLIHLSQINKFNLLEVFSKVYIPLDVYFESTAYDAHLRAIINKSKYLEKISPTPDNLDQSIKSLKKYKLDLGELQAISLCHQLDKRLFLTDDLDAREAAEGVGLEPHGSVGVVALAYRKRHINFEDAKRALYDLYEVSSLFIAKSIIDIAVAELRKL